MICALVDEPWRRKLSRDGGHELVSLDRLRADSLEGLGPISIRLYI